MARLTRRFVEERGVSLIELLVVTTLLPVVLAAALAILDLSVHTAPRDQERAHAIRDAQFGLDAMTREVRRASHVNSMSGSRLDVVLSRGGVAIRVVFRCDEPSADPSFPAYRRCVRQEAENTPGATLGDPKPLIERVLNGASVFSQRAGDPGSYIRVRIKVPARGEARAGYTHTIVLDDGVFLRNLKGTS